MRLMTFMISNQFKRSFVFNKLLIVMILNVTGLLIFFSWYISSSHGLWYFLDSKIFFFFNHKLINNRSFLKLIAVTNNRLFDVVPLLSMGIVIFIYWTKSSIDRRQYIFIVTIVMVLTMITINYLTTVLIPIRRVSPTIFFANNKEICHVNKFVKFSTKASSKASFPSHHGITLLIFSCFVLRYLNIKFFVAAMIIFILFSLPRIIIGAHWFTDIIVGSIFVILISLPWILIMPLSDYIISNLENYVSSILVKKKNIKL